MDYLIALIFAVAVACMLIVKGGNRFNDYNDGEE